MRMLVLFLVGSLSFVAACGVLTAWCIASAEVGQHYGQTAAISSFVGFGAIGCGAIAAVAFRSR